MREVVDAAPLDWKGRARRECQAGARCSAQPCRRGSAEVPAAGCDAWTAHRSGLAARFQAFDAWLGPFGQLDAWLDASAVDA